MAYPHPALFREERGPSALAFVSKVVLGSIAVVLAIALLAALPRGARIPLVVAATIGIVVALPVMFAPRQRARRRGLRPVLSPASAPRGAALHPRGAPHARLDGRQPSSAPRSLAADWKGLAGVSGLLAALSALLIVLAFLAPPELGVSLAVVGLVGLFLVRLAAFHPRGAWPRSTRSSTRTPTRLRRTRGVRALRRARLQPTRTELTNPGKSVLEPSVYVPSFGSPTPPGAASAPEAFDFLER